jgi:hypothetical protein
MPVSQRKLLSFARRTRTEFNKIKLNVRADRTNRNDRTTELMLL